MVTPPSAACIMLPLQATWQSQTHTTTDTSDKRIFRAAYVKTAYRENNRKAVKQKTSMEEANTSAIHTQQRPPVRCLEQCTAYGIRTPRRARIELVLCADRHTRDPPTMSAMLRRAQGMSMPLPPGQTHDLLVYRPYFWNSQSLLSSGHTWRVLSHRLMLRAEKK